MKNLVIKEATLFQKRQLDDGGTFRIFVDEQSKDRLTLEGMNIRLSEHTRPWVEIIMPSWGDPVDVDPNQAASLWATPILTVVDITVNLIEGNVNDRFGAKAYFESKIG